MDDPRALTRFAGILSRSAGTRNAAVRALGQCHEPAPAWLASDGAGRRGSLVRYSLPRSRKLRDEARQGDRRLAQDGPVRSRAAVEALAHLRGGRAFEVLPRWEVGGSDLSRAA